MAKPLHATPPNPRISWQSAVKRGAAGAAMLGITSPMPVQRAIWRIHDEWVPGVKPWRPRLESVALEVPRRAGKTEGLMALAVGRCSSTPDYQVVYAAQSGTKSRERFYAMLRRLRRHGGEVRDWRPRESRGEERIEWDNGSVWRFAPPKADYFRGDAVDWAILDEAQEVDEVDAADLIGSLLPIFDTLEGPQLTVAGTAGESRDGLLWEALEKGRAGQWGILEYAAPDDADLDELLADESRWLKIHPGPAGVSPERAQETLRNRRAQMTPEMFGREYLGIWPLTTAAAAFDLEVWGKLGRPLAADRPTRVGIGFDVTPGGERTAVVAGWRTATEAWVEVIEEAPGTAWAAKRIAALARKYRVPVVHDTAGVETLVVADDIARKFPATTLVGLTTVEFATACAVVDSEVRNGTLRHGRQEALDEAIRVASRRKIRDGGWAWGRVASSGHIHALVAGTCALRGFSDLPPARTSRVLTARTA